MNKKYDRKDFELIIEKRKSITEIAKKYRVSPERLTRQMNRAGYHISQRKILIISPYALVECKSVSEVANQLGVSPKTIYRELKGKRSKVLEELEITIEEETEGD